MIRIEVVYCDEIFISVNKHKNKPRDKVEVFGVIPIYSISLIDNIKNFCSYWAWLLNYRITDQASELNKISAIHL